MRRLMICAAAAMAVCGAASADTLDNLKGNTLMVTSTSGGTMAYIVRADGRAHLSSTRAEVLMADGFWKVDADKPDSICLTMRGQSTACYPLAADKDVGDEWDVKGPTGQIGFVIKIAQGEKMVGPNATHDHH